MAHRGAIIDENVDVEMRSKENALVSYHDGLDDWNIGFYDVNKVDLNEASNSFVNCFGDSALASLD